MFLQINKQSQGDVYKMLYARKSLALSTSVSHLKAQEESVRPEGHYIMVQPQSCFHSHWNISPETSPHKRF